MRNPIRQPKNPVSSPFLVIWEMTQACDLACQHCRANAVTEHHPLALKTHEAEKLLDEVAQFGKPHPLMVFTGGDPFKRPDLTHLVSYAKNLGLHVGVSPSATPLLTKESLASIHDAGAQVISLSIDASNAAMHDDFRRVSGSFQRTIDGAAWAREVGLKLQVNTTLTRHNLDDLVDIAALVYELRVMTWSAFLLVPTGRGENLAGLTAEEIEAVLHFLVDVADYIPIKTTEGHHYKRILVMRRVLQEMDKPVSTLNLPPLYAKLSQAWRERVQKDGIVPRSAARRSPMHINSAQGFIFISHLGLVFPSGFLPISAGSVRRESLVDIYRNSHLFNLLRTPGELKGRCGACEFKHVCGGSRSRAFAVTGDPLAEDPSCAYQPGSFPFPEELARTLRHFDPAYSPIS